MEETEHIRDAIRIIWGKRKTILQWTATDSCGNESSCIQLISVEPIPGPFLICPNDTTLSACQAEVDAAFDAWLMTASFSGGCNASMSNNSMGAPSECGGSVTVTFTVDSAA